MIKMGWSRSLSWRRQTVALERIEERPGRFGGCGGRSRPELLLAADPGRDRAFTTLMGPPRRSDRPILVGVP